MLKIEKEKKSGHSYVYHQNPVKNTASTLGILGTLKSKCLWEPT